MVGIEGEVEVRDVFQSTVLLYEAQGLLGSDPLDPFIVVRPDEQRHIHELAAGDAPPVQVRLQVDGRADLLLEEELLEHQGAAEQEAVLIRGDHPNSVSILNQPAPLRLPLGESTHHGEPHQPQELLHVRDELVVEEQRILEQRLLGHLSPMVRPPGPDEALDLDGGFLALLLGRIAIEHEGRADPPLEEVDAEVEEPDEVGHRLPFSIIQDLVILPDRRDVFEEQVASIHDDPLPGELGERGDVGDEQRG